MFSLRRLLPSAVSSLFDSTYSKVLTFGGNILIVRGAAKKTSSNTNCKGRGRPKHRGVRAHNGFYVEKGKLLVLQNVWNKIRFHPGLNVGMGKNGTLFALESGTVKITTEIADLNWNNMWVQRHYSGRQDQVIYKRYFNVLTKPQHNRFKLLEQI